MKLFGLSVGKEKPVPFPQFRDMVRLTVRREHASAAIENTDAGFNLTLDGRTQTCNLRALYARYSKNPEQCQALIRSFIDSLTVDVTAHPWSEAMSLLRPMLKSHAFLEEAQRGLGRQKMPDTLPFESFVGDLNVIAVVEYSNQVAAVTEGLLEGWGVSLADAMRHAMENMSMMSYPPIVNTLIAGGGSRKSGTVQEEVGLIFEGNHLTATWLIFERFRDYIQQRLQGSYVVAVPGRAKLTAVRADEAGLIAGLRQTNRNFGVQPYALTPQLFHVNASMAGGVVSVLEAAGVGDSLRADSAFAAGQQMPASIRHAAEGVAPVRELNAWFGLSEPTEESAAPTILDPKTRGARKS